MQTTKHVVVFQHVAHETLGTLADYFAKAELPCEVVPLYLAMPGPPDWTSAAGLVVMGGPMNVDQVDRYPFLRDEVRWIQEALARDVPILGICLGAQLLAKALGAAVYPNPVKEIGWYPLELLPAAESDPLFRGSPLEVMVFQWHGDTFELPDGAVHLARSPQCEHQAFRFGRHACGLQFHVEVTRQMVEQWLDEPDNRDELASLDYIDPRAIRAQTAEAITQMEQLGRRILPRFVACCVERVSG